MAHVIPVVSAKILVFSDCRSCQPQVSDHAGRAGSRLLVYPVILDRRQTQVSGLRV